MLGDPDTASGAPEIVESFQGDWLFLNNYYPAPVVLEGESYPTVEHAYQAAKTLDAETRRQIRDVKDPDEAKRLGRASVHRDGWESIKLPLMTTLVQQKFADPALLDRLLATGESLLIEGNDWGDTFWGRCHDSGQNHMGRILMTIRAQARFATHIAKRPYVERLVDTRLPTRYGQFRAIGYRQTVDGREHVALVHGDVFGAGGVLVRMHSECLTGDVLGSLRCECGPQLNAALAAIRTAGEGILVYLRGHEGRGIGLLAKLWTHQLQDAGLDTVDANLALGLPVDGRDFQAGAAILADLGVESVRLLSNNPEKQRQLTAHGVRVVEQIPLLVEPGEDNDRYLRTKKERLGHHLPHLVGEPSTATR